jgi:hypothetical protein
VLRVGWEIGLLLSNGRLVVKDQDGPLGSLEPSDPSSATLSESFLADDGLEDVPDDVPELVVFSTKEDDSSTDLVVAAGKTTDARVADRVSESSRIDLIVEPDLIIGRSDHTPIYSQRGRGVQDGFLDDVLYPGIRDSAPLGKLVETSPGLDSVQESVSSLRGHGRLRRGAIRRDWRSGGYSQCSIYTASFLSRPRCPRSGPYIYLNLTLDLDLRLWPLCQRS